MLGVRFGVNPNSSSLGVDVTYLLFGGTLALAVSLLLGVLLRRGRAEVVGESPEPAEPAAVEPGSGEAAP